MTAGVVLLHGMLGAPAAFGAVRAERRALAQAEAPWLPGHGPHARPSGLRTFADVVDAAAARLGATPSVVVGYSMGGRIALGLAERHPALLAALVLVSTHIGLLGEAERAARRAEDDALAEVGEQAGMAALVAAHVARPLLASQASWAESARREAHARRLAHVPSAIADVVRAASLGAMPDYRGLLAQRRVPVVVLAGEHDARYAALAHEAAALSGTQAWVAKGAGHDVVTEQPSAVADAIARACDGVHT